MSSKDPTRCLLVEDDEDDYLIVEDLLSEAETSTYDVSWASTYDEAREMLERDAFDICLVDYRIGAKTGLNFIQEAATAGLRQPMILMTGVANQEVDVEASQSGAADFLDKTSLTSQLLERSIRYALAHRKQTEALEHQTALLRMTLEHTSAGIAAFDSALQLDTHNTRLLEILNIADEETAMDYPDAWELRKQRLGAAILDQVKKFPFEESFRFELELKNDQVIEVTHNLAPEDRHVVICFDVTERKQTELELRASREAAVQASKAKSEFLANVSHELRTPLNAIIGFSALIRDEELGAIQQRDYVDFADQIHDGGQQLLSIINDLIDLSRIEAGRFELSEDYIDIEAMTSSCLAKLADEAAAKGIALTRQVDDDIALLVGDERAVARSLINLLSNAIKFTAEDGAISLQVRVDDDGGMVFAVADNGIGMDEEELERCLKPFQQADGSLARAYGGTGLGLPLVKWYTELHGARFGIESRKDTGTTVSLAYPEHRVRREYDRQQTLPAAE